MGLSGSSQIADNLANITSANLYSLGWKSFRASWHPITVLSSRSLIRSSGMHLENAHGINARGSMTPNGVAKASYQGDFTYGQSYD